MAQINLKQKNEVRVTNRPSGVRDFSGSAFTGLSAMDRATDNLARGVKHVSDSLFGIYNDLADTRNRQEILEAQTAMFDISSTENERLEERMRRGDFDGEGGVELFKREALKSQDKIQKEFSGWASKNITQNDTRNALSEKMLLEGKRNFAHLSGRFLAYDNERRFNLMKSQCERAVKDGSMVNLYAAIRAYCGGGKDKNGNDIPRRKSQEFEDNLRKEYEWKFNAARLDDAKNYISLETSVDKIEEYLKNFKTTDAYGGLFADEKKIFDVFASNRIASLRFNENQNLKKARKEIVDDVQKGIKTDVSDAYNTCSKLGLDFANVKIAEARENLVGVLDANKVAPGEKKEILSNFDRFCDEAREKAVKEVERAMFKQAEDALKYAVEANDCTLDSYKLSGGNKDFADKIKEARRIRQELSDKNEDIARKIKNKTLSKEEEEYAVNYRRDYFKVLSDAFDYDKDLDARGEKLSNLIVEAQKFDRKSRRELTRLLYDKVIKQNMPADWKAADVNEFDKKFSELSKWGKDEITGWGDDSDPAGYVVLRDRVMNLAVARGLNYQQAIEEAEKDPFYKKIKTKKARQDAIKTLNLNLW